MQNGLLRPIVRWRKRKKLNVSGFECAYLLVTNDSFSEIVIIKIH